jgi:hypothetical protein
MMDDIVQLQFNLSVEPTLNKNIIFYIESLEASINFYKRTLSEVKG